MRKRRLWIGSGLAVLVVIGLLWFWGSLDRWNEPRYQGRSLSWWLESAGTVRDSATDPKWEEAKKALEGMGSTNVIPLLFKRFQLKESWLTSKLNGALESQSRIEFRFREASEDWRLAHTGFDLLHAQAKEAVPELIRLTKDKEPWRRYYATASLLSIIPFDQGLFEVLKEELNDPDRNVRELATDLIERRFPAEAKKLKETKQVKK